ncbi:MAG: LysE family transporter [Thermoplasmata archaeon]
MSPAGGVVEFLATAAAVSVTGAMMPGPVTAAAASGGLLDRWGGVHVALGHGLVEFPTIAAVALGLGSFLGDPRAALALGLAGGTALLVMGAASLLSLRGMGSAKLRHGANQRERGVGRGWDHRAVALDRGAAPDGSHPGPQSGGWRRGARLAGNHVVMGAVTTASNPYYFLWWATLGAALVFTALSFGPAVLGAFALLHWSVDLGWDALIGLASFKGGRLRGGELQRGIAGVCGAMMVAFGIWFVATAASGIPCL